MIRRLGGMPALVPILYRVGCVRNRTLWGSECQRAPIHHEPRGDSRPRLSGRARPDWFLVSNQQISCPVILSATLPLAREWESGVEDPLSSRRHSGEKALEIRGHGLRRCVAMRSSPSAQDHKLRAAIKSFDRNSRISYLLSDEFSFPSPPSPSCAQRVGGGVLR